MKRTRSILMPLFLLAVMLAGSGFHVWHHVLDPHCESSATDSHPCLTCAALHGATESEIGAGIAPPVEHPRDLRATREHETPRPIARGPLAARAPPQV